MSRITNDAWQLIHVRLLTIIESDLKISFCGLSYFIEKLQEDCYPDNSFISEIKSYLNSSQLTCKNLKEWTDFQLMGTKVFSSNLRFQTDIIIQIIKANNYQNALLNNKVLDYHEHKVNLTLFGFILCKLLSLLLGLCNKAELHISSELRNPEIVICIEERTFKKKVATMDGCLPHLKGNIVDDNATLHLCYEILRFYGGNLWLKNAEIEGLKVYFSIPVLKPYN